MFSAVAAESTVIVVAVIPTMSWSKSKTRSDDLSTGANNSYNILHREVLLAMVFEFHRHIYAGFRT